MKKLILALLAAVWLAPAAAHAASALVAEQVTPAKAAKDLFGGSDAVGGIGDWYLSNGKVQAIIDEIGTTTTTSGATVDLTSSQTVETGGTLVDLGLNGKNNDQIDQVFNTGGLSLANVFIFHQTDEKYWADPYIPGAAMPNGNPCVTVGASNTTCPLDVVTDPSNVNCAAITVYGFMLGTCKSSTDFCSTRTNPKLPVRTTYKVCGSERAIHLHTEVWNQSGNPQTLPVFDVFLWGGRGLVPFAATAPLSGTPRGGGFTQPMLDLSSVSNVMKALTLAPFFAAPGNENPADGIMAHGKKVGTVSYGYYPGDSWIDSNGPLSGGTITDVSGGGLASLQSTLLSAAAPFLLLEGKPTVPNDGSVVVERTIVVGLKNDVASVVGDTPSNKDSIFEKSDLKSLLGTVKGSFKPAPTQEGTVTFIRTTGSDDLGAYGDPDNSRLNSAVMSEVRAKGSFKLLLPEGTYTLRAVFPGLPDIGPSSSSPAPTFTVAAGRTTTIPAITVPKAGTLTVVVKDGDTITGIPAKISLSPSPRIRREFAAFSYSLLTGMCSNDLSTECKADTDCGGSNVCFRTCSNVPPQPCAAVVPICPSGFTCASDNYCRKDGCSSDTDCDPDSLCRADTTDVVPESYPGGTAQMQVIYTDATGNATAQVVPGTYSVSVSRGLEYTIQNFTGVSITSGATTQLNSGSAVTLNRVVNTKGYMSADFHIHSGRSFDASSPLEARVNAFASEGVEVMVSTDHDMISDYMPAISNLKMTPFITSIIGDEITTSVSRPPYMANMWGHFNSWPLVYDQTARRNGSVEDEGVSANQVFDRLRTQSLNICFGGKNNGMSCETPSSSCKGGGTCKYVGEHVVTLNHPRAGVSGVVGIGMLANLGYDPSMAITDCASYPVVCLSSQCAGGINDGTNCTSSPTCEGGGQCLCTNQGQEQCLCTGGTNDGTSCTPTNTCTGGGLCGCESASLPLMVNGCNDILLDMNTIPQASLCTNSSCGSSFKGSNNTRNIDFDTMEIDNGGTVDGYQNLIQSRRDWLSILNQGIQVGASDKLSPLYPRHQLYGHGVSDSHRMVMEVAGYSRTFVGAGDLPNPATVDVKTFNDAVMQGNMTATTGPFISFTAANSSTPTTTVNMGSTLGPPVSSVNLNVTVQAAPWVPVDEVRLIKNGCVMACYPPDIPNPELSDNQYDQTTTYVTRFTKTITDTVTADSYYIVEAGQSLPAPSETPTADPVVNSVATGVFTYGFSNPIFVDYDGGGYTGIALASGAGEPTCPKWCSDGTACTKDSDCGAGTTQTCGAVPPPCSPGALIQREASVSPSTMFARATVPQPKPSMLGRLWRTLVGPAVADERQARTPNPEDEERVRRHEREILKPSTERLLWNRIEFPTPVPTPAPGGSGH
jgi:hypothetical protein